MNTEAVCQWLSRKPFEPFLVCLSNGESYPVKHPENVIVLKTRLIVGYPETDSVAHISFLHVDSIKPLEAVS